jgi:hypothetical protein
MNDESDLLNVLIDEVNMAEVDGGAELHST